MLILKRTCCNIQYTLIFSLLIPSQEFCINFVLYIICHLPVFSFFIECKTCAWGTMWIGAPIYSSKCRNRVATNKVTCWCIWISRGQLQPLQNIYVIYNFYSHSLFFVCLEVHFPVCLGRAIICSCHACIYGVLPVPWKDY